MVHSGWVLEPSFKHLQTSSNHLLSCWAVLGFGMQVPFINIAPASADWFSKSTDWMHTSVMATTGWATCSSHFGTLNDTRSDTWYICRNTQKVRYWMVIWDHDPLLRRPVSKKSRRDRKQSAGFAEVGTIANPCKFQEWIVQHGMDRFVVTRRC